MNSSKNIYMILTNGFDPDVRVYKEAKFLTSKGFKIEIICWDREGEYTDKQEEILNGIKIKRFYIKSKPGTGMKQFFPFIKFIKAVRKYLRNKDYSYLHCHDFDGIIVGFCTKKNKSKKIIFDMHEIYNDYSFGKIPGFNFIYNKILKKSDYIIYVNASQKEGLLESIKKKMIYLPNYPEVSLYNPTDKIENKKIRINYIGSLRDYESLKLLAEVGKTNKEIQVGLYGSGTCYKKLKEEYKNTNVIVYGKYDGISEIGKIYRNTDILYCSYNPENLNWKNAYPVKLYEAIITLTPIIVTKNTKADYFVEENSIGLSIEYNNQESLLKAIYEIKNNYSKYVNNIKKIADNYKWENIAINLKNIYCEGENK